MQRTQIYIPKKYIDALRTIARKKNTTISAVIRMSIEGELFQKKGKKAEQKGFKTLFDILKKVKKRGEKGPKDLAKKVDTYLYGS